MTTPSLWGHHSLHEAGAQLSRLARARRLVVRLTMAPKPLGDLFRDARRIVVAPGDEAACPAITALPVAPSAAHLRRPTITTPEAAVVELPGALYSPDDELVVADRPRRIVQEGISTTIRDLEVGPRLRRARAVDMPGTWGVFRSWHNAHYHALIDNIPRVAVLERAALQPRPGLLHGEALTPVERYLLERLAPEVELKQVEPGALYRVERLMLPSFLTRRFSGFLPSWYTQLLHERVLPDRPSRRDRRLLISRRASGLGRRIANEDELHDALAARGFERVELEDLAFADQVELFHDAEAVVGAHGGGLANTVFSKDIALVELFASQRHYPHYYFLGCPLGHRYRASFATQSRRNADILVDPKIVLALLDELGIVS